MVQTAEGALTEVHSMLQRMRELSVQGSNGTLTSADRAAINQELQALRGEVDSISTRTKFNGLNLLAGAVDFPAGTAFGVHASSELTVDDNDANVLTETITFTPSGVAAENKADTYFFSFNGVAVLTLTRTSDGESVTAAALTAGTAGGAKSYAFNFSTGVDVTVGATTLTAATEIQQGNFFTNASFNMLQSTVTVGSKAVAFHIGPDAGQLFNVNFEKVDTSAAAINIATELSNLNSIPTAAEYEALITALDGANKGIAYVSEIRSDLGAAQNRMEAAINNLAVAYENTSAAESRIRDTDVAVESVNFSRAQILQQSGISVLVQANLAPQAVLALLR